MYVPLLFYDGMKCIKYCLRINIKLAKKDITSAPRARHECLPTHAQTLPYWFPHDRTIVKNSFQSINVATGHTGFYYITFNRTTLDKNSVLLIGSEKIIVHFNVR